MSDTRRLPLTAPQRGVWFYELRHPGTPALHQNIIFEMEGVDIQRLRAGVLALAKRHENLQYRLVESSGQFYLSPLPASSGSSSTWPLSEFDLTGVALPAEKDLRATLRARDLESFLTRPFVFDREPLWRCGVIHFGAKKDLFVFVGHHLIVDGVSKNILMRDLTELVNALQESRPPVLPALPDLSKVTPPVVDEKKIEVNRKNLAGLSPFSLPTDFKPQSEFKGEGDHVFFNIPAEMVQELTTLATSQSVKLYRVLFASFFVYLHLVTEHPDICIGAASANRMGYSENVDNVVGDFANPLPVRLLLQGKLSFLEVLKMLSVAFSEGLKSMIPFETVVTQAMGKQEKRRTTTASPFDVIFDMQGKRTAFTPKGGRAGYPYNVRFEHTIFNFLGLNIDENPNGSCDVFIEYNTQLFKRNTIERMAGHLFNVWKGIAKNPGAPISSHSLLTTAERDLLKTVNQTHRDLFFNDYCIVNIFRRVAKERASQRALVFHQATDDGAEFLTSEAEVLTYKEWDRHSTELAAVLRTCDVRPDRLVGVSLRRSARIPVAFMGIMKAGGVFVPFDTQAGEVLNHQITETKPNVIIVDNSTKDLEVFKAWRGPIQFINIDDWKALQKRASQGGSHIQLDVLGPEHLAYATDTSGSTGKPKRVMSTHIGFANSALAIQDRIDKGLLKAGCKVLCTAKFNFDAALFELLEALMTGGELHLIHDGGRLAPNVLQQVISRHELNALTLLPQVCNYLDFSLLPSVYNVVLMGAKSNEGTLQKLRLIYEQRKETGTPLHVHTSEFGVQEAAIFSTLNADQFNQPSSAIGKPIPNVKLFVLDREAKFERPIGFPGELYAAGPGLARGYFGRKEETAKSFLTLMYNSDEHSFSPPPEEKRKAASGKAKRKRGQEEDAEADQSEQAAKIRKASRSKSLTFVPATAVYPMRLYRTGDCVQRLEDGSLDFIGRMNGNRQVKIHGVRVELDAIETDLERHPKVKDSLFIFNPEKETLQPYVILKDARSPISHQEALEFLRLFPLPPVAVARMQPLICVEKFPLTNNGKIDTAALERTASPASLGSEAKDGGFGFTSREEPTNLLETQLKSVWEEALGFTDNPISSISLSFYELGGDSIDIVNLLGLLKKRFSFSREISLLDLNFSMSIKSLARTLGPLLLTNSHLFANAASFFDSPAPSPTFSGPGSGSQHSSQPQQTFNWGLPKFDTH